LLHFFDHQKMSSTPQPPRFADELRALQDAAAQEKAVAAKMTEEEIAAFVTAIKNDAAYQARRGGERSVGRCIDQVRKEIAYARVPAIEAILESEGFEVRYSINITCGFCTVKDCGSFAHHGYFVTW
jgi:hypothetical protein